jgi:diketogulonate reductase-like aldo/keto reductase
MVTGKSPVYRLNNGIEMPAFGLGVFRSEPEKTVAAVRSAVANGYRLIDTAAAYMNEQQVGEGIRSSGVPREDVFVTTKVWITDYGYDQTLRAFDRSLLKLGFNVLDLYRIHWPVPSAFEATIDAYKAALKLLEDGRVRAIGVCNFSSSHLHSLIEKTGHIPAVNQVELHPFFVQRELREAGEKHGIITQAWSPIGGIKRDGKRRRPRRRCMILSPIRQWCCSPGNTERPRRRLSCAGRSSWARLPSRSPCARNGLPRTSISSASHLRRRKFRQSARSTPANVADRTRSR